MTSSGSEPWGCYQLSRIRWRCTYCLLWCPGCYEAILCAMPSRANFHAKTVGTTLIPPLVARLTYASRTYLKGIIRNQQYCNKNGTQFAQLSEYSCKLGERARAAAAQQIRTGAIGRLRLFGSCASTNVVGFSVNSVDSESV